MIKEKKSDAIMEKLDYLGLDMQKIPSSLINAKPIRLSIPRAYDEKQYKQYRYISVKDIQILLTPTNRLDPIEEKYKKASPLADYLDSESEENFVKHTTFLNMLRKFKIRDVENLEEEQENLNKKIPYKVKFQGNYLWQIYYSEITEQYFMLVPTEDTDYSAFFYLLKKKIENKKSEKIFVPIRNLDYESQILKKSEIEDIGNYMWIFTKNWPLIYEVYDKEDKPCIHIIGETEIYEKISSPYKIRLEDEIIGNQFYKLLKAMFILQTELPHYFVFKTNIDKNGEIEFYVEDRKIEYSNIAEWINKEYYVGEDKLEKTEDLVKENKQKLEKLKQAIAQQEIEYLAKEKQISTFLECKKTFFGKFKYFFKYSGKSYKNKMKNANDIFKDNLEDNDDDEPIKKRKKQKENYNIEEIVDLYKNLEGNETELKDLVMDINSLKLKNKNMKKKIENATAFIEEIDSHKKSIFEFWKYSNKDEVASLPEGEEEEVNVIKRITKVFNYEEDLEKFGTEMDKRQRRNLSKEETDSIFLTTTDVIEVLNKIKNNDITPKDIESNLRDLKMQARKEKVLDKEEFDIFGGIAQDSTKISKLNNKKHREVPKDKFSILEISKNTNQIGYKLTLENRVDVIKKSLQKVAIPEDIPVYKAIIHDKINNKDINIFNINPEKELKEALKTSANKINFYKINLKEGINAISYTNCIFFDNQNRTLPVGQDISTKMLVDISKLKIKLQSKKLFNVVDFQDPKDDFTKLIIRTICLHEYDIV